MYSTYICNSIRSVGRDAQYLVSVAEAYLGLVVQGAGRGDHCGVSETFKQCHSTESTLYRTYICTCVVCM